MTQPWEIASQLLDRALRTGERAYTAAPDDDDQFEEFVTERAADLDHPAGLAEALLGHENATENLLVALIGRVQTLADPQGLDAITKARKIVLDWECDRWEPK